MRKIYWDQNNKLDVRKAWGKKKKFKVAETCFIKKEEEEEKVIIIEGCVIFTSHFSTLILY
jgi:hypothetical protein